MTTRKLSCLKDFSTSMINVFNMIKSLLKEDLKLTSKMQDEYDRVKIADLMEMKFRGPACVDKLIELVRDIDEIKDLANSLRKEKLKAIKKNKAKGATPVENQGTSSLGQSTSTANEASGSESVKDTPVKKWAQSQLIYYEIRDDTGVMEVMVYGQRLTSISCEEGDRLTLVCFELAESRAKRQLRSVIHSYIKVTKVKQRTTTQF
uniref:Interferon gamma inducible protein 16-like protein transcript variant 3 n=1 Tax=Capra hircus TaxID=9925 RepID=A0A286S9Z0_CAPHI|nr:interferon gamma inducible protein 16-like protein transcript variant 3 [Capra hircus]